MQKVIGVTDLQRNFRSVLDEVTSERVPYVLIRGSRPEAALIPYDEFMRYQSLHERDVLQRVDSLLARLAEQNEEFDEAEAAKDVAAAIAEVRGASR